MKTTFDVIDTLYPLINVVAITALLDGRVYRDRKPVDSIKRDIVILSLPITGGQDIDLQNCTAIINCHCPDIAPGIPDNVKLRAIATKVITAIEAYTVGSSYFNAEINSQLLISDYDQPGMSYVSIRVNCTIQFLP